MVDSFQETVELFLLLFTKTWKYENIYVNNEKERSKTIRISNLYPFLYSSLISWVDRNFNVWGFFILTDKIQMSIYYFYIDTERRQYQNRIHLWLSKIILVQL